jgi:hypothetical protein
MNMFLPASDSVLPWTALLLGLWIPNFYYWGLNQYITQRTLGSASLAQGQKGIVFAAFMKLLIPFVIVIPGIIAFNLYSTEMRQEASSDTALGLARYLKANPATQQVQTMPAPTEAQIAAWAPGHYLIALYPDDAAVAAVAIYGLRVISLGFPLFAAGMVLEQSFNGAGDTWTPTWLNLFAFWIIQIPLAWFLAGPIGLHERGVFISVTVAYSVLAAASAYLFRQGKWKAKYV